MPVISMFYGLIISMYYLDTMQHNLAHVHVKFAEMEPYIKFQMDLSLNENLPSNKEN